MKRLELIGNGNSLSEPILIGREILEVSVDGFGRSKLLISGTPVDKEVLYDSISGTLTFPESLNGEQVFILYQDA